MGHTGKGYDINQTFIIEAQSSSGNTPSVSACTAIYSNALFSCSGNTNIILGNGIISFNGNLYTNNNISGTTIYASTYYGDGSNLTGISTQDTFVTGGTYSNGTAIFTNNTGGTFNVSGFSTGGTSSSTFTGGTVSGATNFTGGLSANTFSATTYLNLPIDIRVTGATKSGSIATFTNNTGGTFTLTGLSDVFVTGGTYTNGNAIFTNNTGGTFNVTGFPIGSGGGQLFYLNISQAKNGNRYLSTTGSTASEQSTAVTISNGVTGTIASFQSDQLNTTLIPGGIWSFYLHSYKQHTNAAFNIFVEVYKLSSGGTQTLLFTTDPTPVTTNSPNPSMQLTDGYFSGTSISTTDSILAVVRATNTGNQSHTITLFSEGNQHYSYVVSTLPTQQGLTCDTLSGCSIIQTIQSDILSKLSTSGGTITGNLIVNGSLSATTYQNLPLDIRVTGGTFNNNNGITTFTNNTGGTFTVNNFPTTGTTLLWTAGTNTYSVAQLGGGNIASGAYSLAVGSGTTASGVASHAGGFNTSAYTPYSFAIGVNSIASGSSVVSSASPITIVSAITITLSDPTYSQPAVVLSGDVFTEWKGYYHDFCSPFTIYSGSSSQIIDCNTYTDIYEDSGLTYIVDSSIVSTNFNMISGDTFESVSITVLQPAFAIGEEVKAYGANSFAEGGYTRAYGDYSHAEGYQSSASGLTSHAEGQGTTASGIASHAEGSGTLAYGDYSHAEGYATIASVIYSHAEGQGTTASGGASHAEGAYTTASGSYSHAEGQSTTASGNTSHAEGYQTTASGGASHAKGYQTTASGIASHAEGRETISSGDYSHAEGQLSIASGTISHAEGQSTTASGAGSHAEGYQTTASGGYSHAEGYGSMATGNTSHAEGGYARAFGEFSHAEGQLTMASGTTSHAEGFTTTASGYASHAEGLRTTASVDFSHAEGYETIASGNTSHAEGVSTTASGDYSHAEGRNTTASGFISHSEGNGTRALGTYSHAEGEYNIASGGASHAEGSGTTSFGSVSHSEGDRTKALGNYSHAEGQLSIASGTTSHAEGYGTTALGNYSHAGGYQSSASGTYSFVHGNNSVAQNSSTIVLGSNITGTSINTTYVDSLNIKTINSGTVINNLGYDSNGNIIIGASSGLPITGTTSIDFGAAVSGETSYTMVTVNSALVTENSNIVLTISGSTNHPDIEDSMIDGVVITKSDIVNNVSFNINAFSSEGTWGVYNIKYLIIN